MIKSHDFASTYVGTPFYMSPEICNAEKYTLKSDIWSLGCIIYELCAREPPFNAKSHYQLVQKIKDGKVATLPDIYSPELNQVIRDCLRVNPDTRPDTASLLNLPVVRLMRKEKEVVDLNRGLRAREDAVARREKEVADKVASLESSRAAMRHEVDASLRREWEVKARLEIDRLVQSELEALKAQFETEVQARVDKLLGQQLVQQAQAKAAALAQAQQQHREQQQQQQQQQQQLQSRQSSRSSADFDSSKSSSCNTASSASASADDFQTAHGVVGDADLMVDTSLAPPSILGPPTPATSAASAPPTALASKRSSAMLSARTPYHRAQTMFVGTPMDVEMASPSPVAIQNLSLSPRRGGATKPPGSAGNIFTNRAGSARSSNDNDSAWASRDSDDDEAMMPSPSVVRNPRSIKNPFTSKSKPVLQSQQQQQQTSSSAPSSSNKGLSKLRAALSSASSKSAAAAAQAAAAAAAAAESSAAAHTSDRRSGATARHVSPDRPDRADRRLSKIPSVASLHNVHLHHGGGDSTPSLTVTTSIPRRGSMDRKPSSNDLAGRHAQDQHASYQQPASAIAPSSSSSGWTSKVVSSSKAKGIRGRTLIELQQARAYGRPLSAVVSGTSPSACLMGGSNGSSSASETPSPKRAAAAVGGLGGSGGNRENSGLSAPARPGHDRRASSGSTSTGCLTIDTSVVAVWDPELEDDMPSPFLKTRHVSMF
jgi:NIMA (never in mitosis gene a)-related kinase